jgi:hypothetical protein
MFAAISSFAFCTGILFTRTKTEVASLHAVKIRLSKSSKKKTSARSSNKKRLLLLVSSRISEPEVKINLVSRVFGPRWDFPAGQIPNGGTLSRQVQSSDGEVEQRDMPDFPFGDLFEERHDNSMR